MTISTLEIVTDLFNQSVVRCSCLDCAQVLGESRQNCLPANQFEDPAGDFQSVGDRREVGFASTPVVA